MWVLPEYTNNVCEWRLEALGELGKGLSNRQLTFPPSAPSCCLCLSLLFPPWSSEEMSEGILKIWLSAPSY